MGWIGVAFGLGTILGPILGGVMIATLEWQWIFLINLPIAGIILLLISNYHANQEVIKKAIDFKGIVILSLIILSIMVGISNSKWVYVLVGLLFLPVLVLIEKKQVDPVLNLKYFKDKRTLTILIASFISGFVMATTANLIPYFSEMILGMDKGMAGLSVAPLAITSVIASFIGGVLVDKLGAKKVLFSGFIITFIGALSLALLDQSIILFYLTILLMGFGIGIIIGAPLKF